MAVISPNSHLLPTTMQNHMLYSRYSRFDNELGRRQDWGETVSRYGDFFETHLKQNHDFDFDDNSYRALLAISNLDILPSMRCLMTAGPALLRDHITGYNCAYCPIDNVRAFDEILFILMCAAGVGFSVERQYVNQLPELPELLDESGIVITVRDSKRGWAEAFRELLSLLYAGRIPSWDTSKLRLAGSILKTMGGRSSGPEPLIKLFEFTIRLFKEAIDDGKKRLSSIQCHDLVCMIGRCVVVGGVRRSALISLSNLSDLRMRTAKSGDYHIEHKYRAIANNSVAYTERPELLQFMEEWTSIYASNSGERGIFNREAAHLQAVSSGRRVGTFRRGGRDVQFDWGTNPCSEIILRAMQFCNLSTIAVRPSDTMTDLEDKIMLAAILGTWQSSLVNFRYIRRKWKTNCEEERLLGVSMTGIQSNDLINVRASPRRLKHRLKYLKEVVVETNKKYAAKLGIPQSAATTCVKPEGSGTLLVGADSSGISPAESQYIIRRTREDANSPLTQMLMGQGVPHEVDNDLGEGTMVVSFPCKVSKNVVKKDEVSALQQLEHWKMFQDNWCEHKPSITVYLRKNEWMETGAWVWKNFDSMSGVSFLPHDGGRYEQMPMEAISKDQYEEAEGAMPDIDWSKLTDFEKEDMTTGSHELACVAGQCAI